MTLSSPRSKRRWALTLRARRIAVEEIAQRRIGKFGTFRDERRRRSCLFRACKEPARHADGPIDVTTVDGQVRDGVGRGCPERFGRGVDHLGSATDARLVGLINPVEMLVVDGLAAEQHRLCTVEDHVVVAGGFQHRHDAWRSAGSGDVIEALVVDGGQAGRVRKDLWPLEYLEDRATLAVRAAYDCTPEQFKRIIFLSVKDCEMDDDGERKLTGFILPGSLEILNELARELGQPDIPKSPEDQRIRLLLEALRPAQALLILDNLESLPKSDRDQLFTFVKRLPQGCKAILTSRRLIGSGSELLILEQLDQVVALATLTDLARHNKLLAKTNEGERIKLYEKTGGKPLLLRWIAGQFGRGSCRTLSDALHFLSTCPPDNNPLEFIFGDLVDEFTQDETAVLCALTYFTLPAQVEHIATVAGRDKEPTVTALATLANRSLVVPDQEESAFALWSPWSPSSCAVNAPRSLQKPATVWRSTPTR